MMGWLSWGWGGGTSAGISVEALVEASVGVRGFSVG